MGRSESETDYEWTYYELSDDSDPVSTFNRFIKEESLRERLQTELVPVDLTNENEKLEEILSEPPWEKSSTDDEDYSPKSDKNPKIKINDICDKHQDSKQWFNRQDLARKIEILNSLQEGELEADDSVPEGIMEWFVDLSDAIGDMNNSIENRVDILQEVAFENEVVALQFSEISQPSAAPKADFILRNPETIVLILQTGYILIELVEKQYKYKPHKKIREKSLNIKSKLEEKMEGSIDKEVVGKPKVRDEMQSTLDEYHED